MWLDDIHDAQSKIDEAQRLVISVRRVLDQVNMIQLADKLDIAVSLLEDANKLTRSGIDANLKEGLDEVNKNQAAIFNAIFAAAVTEDKENA